MRFKLSLLLVLWSVVMIQLRAQTLPLGSLALNELVRRQQVLGNYSSHVSFSILPLQQLDFSSQVSMDSKTASFFPASGRLEKKKNVYSGWMPLRSQVTWNTKRPYGWGNGPMIPNVGLQNYTTFGFYGRWKFLKIQLQPELVYAQNLSYDGFPDTFSTRVTADRFFYWNHGDNPERFGEETYSQFWWGQSKVSLNFGPVELGGSSENIWWGPGQFNSLIFSNNAKGFPHLTLNTSRPIQTFLGNFEGQLIMGRLESSGYQGSQNEALNERYFVPLPDDWKYLNGLSISYNPRWVPNLFVGASRTFQQFNEDRRPILKDYFPVFEFLTKKKLHLEGNVSEYDLRGQDQQMTIFGRYLVPKARAEIYFEFGRRDHAYDWRELLLNPEHARAYLFGFQKLFSLDERGEFVQIRGELTHQQESVNRYIRYLGLDGNQTWHTHGKVRGFTNYGESLGVGIGQGSNVQTLEVSRVSGLNKRGILVERLANNQDFFYRAFGQDQEKRPWIDLSLGLLWDQQWDRLILSSKAQYIYGLNYQWQSESDAGVDFPKGNNLGSISAQVSLIYSIQKR